MASVAGLAEGDGGGRIARKRASYIRFPKRLDEAKR